MTVAPWAESLAHELLAGPLPRRWAHTRGVATQAKRLAPLLKADADLVVAAAWLHDIGYSPAICSIGFHPLDGARHLRDAHKASDLLCRLVAYHSCALIESAERGLDRVLIAEFDSPPAQPYNALTYCDMTTGPDGTVLSIDDRFADILERYGPGHVVRASILQSAPLLRASHDVVAEAQSRCGGPPAR